MDERAQLYAAYRDQLRAGPLRRQLRVGIALVVFLQSCFIFVDHWTHPELFWQLASIRLLWNIALLAVLLYLKSGDPLGATVAGCVTTGLGLIAVTTVAGGPSGDYFPALMLLFLGMPVLLPIAAREAAAVVGSLLAIYAVSPIALEGSWGWRDYVIYICFPSAAAVECVASCALLEGFRFRDFVQRRQLERARDELRDLDRAKSQLTANVHHELRTPLTLILAPLEAMASGDFGPIPERVADVQRTMYANGLRLLRLINNLLELSKLESSEVRLSLQTVNLGELVGSVVERAAPLADRKRISLSAACDPDLPMVLADPDAAEKVVVNLVGNALKFTEAGSVGVHCGRTLDGRSVHIVVSDTGAGIESGQLEKIFDRFAQADGTATRRHEGTGIGLSLVRELVSLHGGRAWAESQGIGLGSKFHAVFPVKGVGDGMPGEDGTSRIGDASPEVSGEGSITVLEGLAGAAFADVEKGVRAREGNSCRQVEAGPSGAPLVVVADDNEEMRNLLAALLAREFRVVALEDGKQALAEVRERRPALVVTDVMMPELSGTELCKAIKDDTVLRSTPIILLTSKAEREMRIEGLELGADDYVTKPFHPRELMARVRSLARLGELQREVATQNLSLAAANADLEQALRELKDAEVHLVQAERLAAVGELSAGVAHEVNNPLNFARNSLATLRAYVDDVREVVARVAALDPSDPEALAGQVRELERKKAELRFEGLADDLGELVRIVTEGLDRTARLVADLRDFAAPGRGQWGPVDVREGLRSTLQLLGHRMRQAGCNVEVELPEELPPVQGDSGALNQVFLNLLKNAAEVIESTGRGTVRVGASVEGSELRVRVQDDGPGMDSEVKSRLFEPFFTTKEAGEGTGLGLSMCRRIVSEHGGAIEVESAPGEGTTMTVRLPLSSPAAPAPGAALATADWSD